MKTNETNNELKSWVVYTHKDLTTGDIFYVGCGKPTRPKSKHGRNNDWQNTFNSIGGWANIEITIEGNYFSQDEAYGKEIYLIDLHGRKDLNTGSLVNKCAGGAGVSGKKEINKFRKVNSPIFDFTTGIITTTNELNKNSVHAPNYYYRKSCGMRGDNTEYKFIDMMSNFELKNIAKQYGNTDILKFIK